jgi:Uncharacterized phage-encoded protein
MVKELFEKTPGNACLSGRELHRLCKSTVDYLVWFNQVFQGSYKEGEDYIQRFISVPLANGTTKTVVDHLIRLHMAMEPILMVSDEVSHAIRMDVLDMASQWMNDYQVMERAAKIISDSIATGDETFRSLLFSLCPELSTKEASLSYEDGIRQSNEPRTITEIAHDYGLSAVRLNRILEGMDVQYRVYGTWRLRPTYDTAGYVVKESHGYGDQEGAYHEGYRLKWTQEGQLFIFRLLKALGFHPRAGGSNHGRI